MDPVLKRNIESLAAELIDDRLEEARREELNFLLRDSEHCRRHFNSIMDVQCGMVEFLSQDVGSNQTTENAGIHRHLDAPMTKERIESRSDWRFASWVAALASLAAILLVSIGLMNAQFIALTTTKSEVNQNELKPTPSNDARKVSDSEGKVVVGRSSSAEYFDKGPMEQGDVAEVNREYILTSGMVMLKFPEGAEVIVQGPSVFSVRNLERLLMKLGRCSVYAPPGAEGFRVDTPQTEVIDLGTRFSVEVNEVGQTDVHVVEGAAEVHRAIQHDAPLVVPLAKPHNNKPVTNAEEKKGALVTNGQARRFYDDPNTQNETIRFDPSSYLNGLPDQVIKYRCSESEGLVNQLESITAQRANQIFEYNVDDLIGIEVFHFVAQKNALNIATVTSAGPTAKSLLESDRSLATGLINPGGARLSLQADPILNHDSKSVLPESTPGIGFRFLKPVKNGPGPDMVLFDLQSKVDSPNGDGFHLSPLHFSEGLKSHTITRYDISMKSARALPVVPFELLSFGVTKNLLQFDLQQATGQHKPTLQFYGLVVGVDFSDLGYPIDSYVDALFLQDDANEDRQIDPVFIAGFPDFIPKN